MTERMITIAMAVRDRECRRQLTNAVNAMDGVTEATGSGPTDVLIFEVERGREKEFLETRAALMEQVTGEVFLVCADPHPKFLILAMRAGIQEVLPLPLKRQDLARAVSRYRDRNQEHSQAATAAEGTGRVVGVLGARPGVGATTLAVNLGVELQKAGAAALMDMAVPLSEAPLFLDVEYTYSWGDVAGNLSRLDATYLRGVMARHSSGLSLLASPGDGYLSGEFTESMPRIMEEMRRTFAHTVIDTDALLSPCGLHELDRADDVILVMNLTLPCLAHAQRLGDALRALESGGTRVHVAASRHLKHSDILPAEAEEVLGRKIRWLIPEDSQGVLSALNQGRTLSEAAPKSAATKAVRAIARTFADVRTDTTRRSGLAGLFRGRRGDRVSGMREAGMQGAGAV